MKSLRIPAALALSLGVLAGCSGGSSSTPSTPIATAPAVAAADGKSAVSITFRFPGKAGTAPAATSRRSPAYLSFATKSAKVTLTNTVGGAVTTFSFPALSQTTSGCAVNGSDLVCTESQFAPPGSYTAAATAYDTQNFGGNITSQLANFAVTVAPGNQSVLLTLGGLVQTATLTILNAATMAAPPTTETIQLLAYDADGYLIVGPYSSAITLTDSDAGTATQLQIDGQTPGPTIGTVNSGDTIALLYNATIPAGSDTISGSIATAGQKTAPTIASAVFTPTAATGGRSLIYVAAANATGNNVNTLVDLSTATMTGTSSDNVALFNVPGSLYTVQGGVGGSQVTLLTSENEIVFSDRSNTTGATPLAGFAERPVPAASSATPPSFTTPDFVSTVGSFVVGNQLVQETNEYTLNFYPVGNSNGTALPSKSLTIGGNYTYDEDGLGTVAQDYDAAGNIWWFSPAGVVEFLASDLLNAPNGATVNPHTVIGYGTNANTVQNTSFGQSGDIAFDAAGNIYIFRTRTSPNVLVFPVAIVGTTTAATVSSYYYTASVPAADATAGTQLGQYLTIDPATGDVIIPEINGNTVGKLDFFYPYNYSSVPPGTIVPLKQYSLAAAPTGSSVHVLNKI